MMPVRADDLVLDALGRLNQQLAEYFDANVLMLNSPIRWGLDDAIRSEIEGVCESSGRRSRLVVLLETNGGYVEVTERIYAVFRKHFDYVDFVVPNYAYSAGTILVLSGDRIYMDYYSVLGPIDPQFESDGQSVPGMGYLAKFDELVERINRVPTGQDETVRAEIAYLIKRFDPAKLFHIEQAIEHSKTLLKAWLPRHKFSSWTVLESSGQAVTDAMKTQRAADIAEILGNAKRWHSHGRGISIRELASEEIKLKIDDFGADQALNSLVRHYHGLFTDFCARSGLSSAMHSSRGFRRI